jgi:hypothetical protein
MEEELVDDIKEEDEDEVVCMAGDPPRSSVAELRPRSRESWIIDVLDAELVAEADDEEEEQEEEEDDASV